MKIYRFLTGPDDSSFCRRITEALLRITLSYGDRCTPGLTHVVAELDLDIDILG